MQALARAQLDWRTGAWSAILPGMDVVVLLPLALGAVVVVVVVLALVKGGRARGNGHH